ncbi:LysM peptidoglycan-binding domain-containing protein [Rhodobacterales bacterium LSUCC0031]|nr:LysM peptidoglycan-binding domain-containing protein [Rhodobacterales bacterium LSUCC0031]
MSDLVTYRKFSSVGLSGHMARAALAGGALAACAGGAWAQDDAGRGLALLRALGLAPANTAAAPVEAAPSASAPTPARPAGPALRAGATYVIQPGDTLGSIAGRIAGASVTWRDLCELNADVLADCDAVEVGTRIALPGGGGAAPAAATVDAGSAAGSSLARSPIPTPRPIPQSATATEAAPPPPSETRLAALQVAPPGGVAVAGIEALSGGAANLVGLGVPPAPAARPSRIDAGPDEDEPVDVGAPASEEAIALASLADPETEVEPAAPPEAAAAALEAHQPPAPVDVASAEPIELAAAAPLEREAEAEAVPAPDPWAGADLGSVDGSEVAADGPRVLGTLSYGPGGLPLALRSYHLHRIEAVADGVRVSGHVPGLYSTGTTGGAFLRLGEGFEGEAAGKTIRVTVTLSGPAGGAVAVAYSTNDLGNSGWRGITLTPEPAEHEFDYAVPPLVRGNGDFIGIDPDPEGTGQAVTVHAIRVDVFEGAAP